MRVNTSSGARVEARKPAPSVAATESAPSHPLPDTGAHVASEQGRMEEHRTSKKIITPQGKAAHFCDSTFGSPGRKI